MITLYGIKNCDTVKKARAWLDKNELTYTFHDFRLDGLETSTIDDWLKAIPKDTLVNKRSTTWKQLSDEERAHFDSEILTNEAKELLTKNPTLIKRPVLAKNKNIKVGFKEADYTHFFN